MERLAQNLAHHRSAGPIDVRASGLAACAALVASGTFVIWTEPPSASLSITWARRSQLTERQAGTSPSNVDADFGRQTSGYLS
ncbi:hypothetical protein ABT158_45275 [Nonomuraea sp. NPDC001636]|uniref:hypothetical protein n=1 Tax=Nonomuraea sp. NPDC001636 TaxID=3154391 RepID=UPI00332FC66A